MKSALSVLLIAGIVGSADVRGVAQTPDGRSSAAAAQPQPTPPQAIRDISKVLRERDSAAAGEPAPSSSKSAGRLVTHTQVRVIQAGGRTFIPLTEKCTEAIQDALNKETLVPAPDEKCADMMEDALDARLRTGQ